MKKKTVANTKIVRRKHDPFFKYIYCIPENTRVLLRLAQRKNPKLRRMLSAVDMATLELIPGNFSNVREWGEADLAFKARTIDGPEIFVGILLEHKSYRKKDVLSQIYRYTFEVMVNKGATDFGWLPTKAIIIYNGQTEWNPVAEFQSKYGNSLNGKELPFECILVNLADIPDSACLAESNVEAALGILVMKYAFDAEKLRNLEKDIAKRLLKMENEARATIIEKIELYLGEFLDEDIVQELKMRMSIGQALGIPTAGDRRRAAERAGLRRGMKRGMQKGIEEGMEKGVQRGFDILESLGVSRKLLAKARKIAAQKVLTTSK